MERPRFYISDFLIPGCRSIVNEVTRSERRTEIADGRTYQKGKNPDELYLVVGPLCTGSELIAHNEAGEVAKDQVETATEKAIVIELFKKKAYNLAVDQDLTYITCNRRRRSCHTAKSFGVFIRRPKAKCQCGRNKQP